jgi:integrase
MASALTSKSVESLKSAEARREMPDGLVVGLYLVVQPTGAKSWALRYRHAGNPRKLALGSLAPALPGAEPDPVLGAPLTLAGARKIARDQLLQIAAGRDPGAERQAAKATSRDPLVADRDLVKTVAAQFLSRYLKPRAKPNYYKGVSYILDKDVLPRWGERRIQDIGRRDVLDLLDAVVGRGAAVQANRVLAAVRKFFNWAVSRDIIQASPAAGVKAPGVEASRDRILTDAEINLFWLACDQVGFPFGTLGKLMLLTGTRRGEASGLRRSELNSEGSVWTLPAARTKNKRPLAIPLSAPAIRVVAEAPIVALSKADLEAAVPRQGKHRDLAFTTTGSTPVSGFAKGKARLDDAMLAIARKEVQEAGGDPEDVRIQAWTFHDLRRTFASGMARLGTDLPVIERCLNHVSGSFGGVVGIYQRHTYEPEMRTAFASWGSHVEVLLNGEPRSNITPMAGGRRKSK